jgi:UDP-2,3-diacylglucosamine pyrophosphatase LpxH
LTKPTRFQCMRMSLKKRNIDLVVLSDVHLGTHGSRADELLRYLRSIAPKRVILNGDMIDIWQFRKHFWPKNHTAILRHFMQLLKEGVQIDYICGNHDELMRRYLGFELGNFSILNHVVLEQNGKKVWVFHGDAFDKSMNHKWVAKWGGRWYDRTIRLNKMLNWVLAKFGGRPRYISKAIKDWVKGLVKKKHNWEEIAANAAIEKGYDMVVVGHIHKPEIREVSTGKGSVMYLNSGDWMENLTSLEYNEGRWSLFKYQKEAFAEVAQECTPAIELDLTDEVTFALMLQEFGMQAS